MCTVITDGVKGQVILDSFRSSGVLKIVGCNFCSVNTTIEYREDMSIKLRNGKDKCTISIMNNRRNNIPFTITVTHRFITLTPLTKKRYSLKIKRYSY